ncbi:MAG: tRNA (adenosine(37)-N6)-dimethylallyltransferase MiaA [Gammaproteobacteria bacterium HGW-Gammaproteobacteria-3]|nr:MAG: tRNA (adenosine(37)-N6)-dimethylallyltransferase MiaA [Gammaproteobacteria bacterium HGW-Gammaproteobacteria-3]
MINLDWPPAIFLMGPTASGKTALSVQLAQAIDAEIISVDSALVYKGMDIGTAKPTLEERGGIAHHLIDIIDPSEAFSTGQFRHRALALMADISERGKIPLLVGGTLLYFNALTQGLAQLPPANPAIRKRLEQELAESGKAAMHQKLAAIDPEAAARIHPNDPQRVQRALEVFELTGQPLSALFRQTQTQPVPYRITKLVLAPGDRKVLHERIALRFRHMLDQGLIEEVQKLYQRGDLSEKMPSLRTVGYRQVWSYLHGEYDEAALVEKAIVATRQLAKRQFTWLRRETDAHWFTTDPTHLLENIKATLPQP